MAPYFIVCVINASYYHLAIYVSHKRLNANPSNAGPAYIRDLNFTISMPVNALEQST